MAPARSRNSATPLSSRTMMYERYSAFPFTWGAASSYRLTVRTGRPVAQPASREAASSMKAALRTRGHLRLGASTRL